MEILSIQNIGKQYLGHKALSDISFRIHSGEILGLLGPNGAGKTSLLRIIAGIIKPDQGNIIYNLKQQTASIGYLPEERGLYKKMKVLDQLVFFGRLKGLSGKVAKEKAIGWLKIFGLSDRQGDLLEQLSKGMQQKVQLIVAFLHEPELVILDEPFSGFDPVNQDIATTIMFDLRKKGTSFILSTHRMDTIPTYCSRVIMLNKGCMVLSGTVDEVQNRFSEGKYLITGVGNLNPGETYSIDITEKYNNLVKAVISIKPGVEANQVLKEIIKDFSIHSFSELKPGFEEIFLKVLNEDRRIDLK